MEFNLIGSVETFVISSRENMVRKAIDGSRKTVKRWANLTLTNKRENKLVEEFFFFQFKKSMSPNITILGLN